MENSSSSNHHHHHVVSIPTTHNINNAPEATNRRKFQLSLPDLKPNNMIPRILREKKIQQIKEAKNIIHSIKVGTSLLLVSLLYLLDPLYEQVGENAMWAIMTVVVIFEFTAGATLGKGLNRAMGTISGGGLGCILAILAQNIVGVGNTIIIGSSVFIFGMVATYVRMIPSIKKRYDYGVMIFMLTYNLVVVSGVRTEQQIWEIARDRLSNIFMGFIVTICVNLFVFPLWASDELHASTVSTFHHLADSFQGCLEEYMKLASEKENEAGDNFKVCKSLLNSKSKDELLANFAKWEPWHGKFGFCYPWEKYLKIGEVLRDLAATILALEGCLRASRKAMALESASEIVQTKSCEAIGSRVVWTLRELGDSMKQMRKCEADPHISSKLKSVRAELGSVISSSKIAAIQNTDALAVVSFVFLLKEVVNKVEELTKEVEQVGDIAGFQDPSAEVSS